ncbi:MAG: DUF58 domain-containing protein [Candidatus Thermoplasmatota archaeon]|nr:DUF58 domain-containing protein [Candidatus Thermoplasmatota archaeon]
MSGFSSRAIGYSSASIVLIVLSVVMSSRLFLIGGLLCLAVMLLSFSFIPARPRIERDVERNQIFESETLDVGVRVDTRQSMGNLEIYDRISPGLEVRDSSNCAMLPPGKRFFRYEIEAPLRGYHPLGPTSVRRWDPMWLWFLEEEIDNTEQLTVFPSMEARRAKEMLVLRAKQRPGEMRLRRVGMGKEFHSIRDYTPSDPFNTINWKATARTGKLLVNQFEAESVTDIMFLLDARMVTRVGTMVDNPLERSIRFIASVTAGLLQTSNRVGLIIYGSTVSVFKPMGGPSALPTILHTLTNVTPSGYNTLGATVSYSLSYLDPNVPVIMFSPLSEDPTIKEAVKNLIGRGHPLTIISPSGVEFERGVYLGKLTPKYLLKRLSRENLLTDLHSMGARVLDWTPDMDLTRALEEVWG